MESIITLSVFPPWLELSHRCGEPAAISPPEPGCLTQRRRVTPLPPGDSSWTIMVPEIPGRCLNKPPNRAIILKQKVTSGVTTGPEINKDPNYQPSTGLIFGHRLPAVQETIRFQVSFIPSDEVTTFYLRVSVLMFKLCESGIHIKYYWMENLFFFLVVDFQWIHSSSLQSDAMGAS